MEQCAKTIGGSVGLFIALLISLMGTAYIGSTWINIYNVLMFLAIVGLLSMLVADEVYDEEERQKKLNLVASLWIAINGVITIPNIMYYNRATSGYMNGWGGWYVFVMVIIGLSIISLVSENVIYDNELFPELVLPELQQKNSA